MHGRFFLLYRFSFSSFLLLPLLSSSFSSPLALLSLHLYSLSFIFFGGGAGLTFTTPEASDQTIYLNVKVLELFNRLGIIACA